MDICTNILLMQQINFTVIKTILNNRLPKQHEFSWSSLKEIKQGKADQEYCSKLISILLSTQGGNRLNFLAFHINATLHKLIYWVLSSIPYFAFLLSDTEKNNSKTKHKEGRDQRVWGFGILLTTCFIQTWVVSHLETLKQYPSAQPPGLKLGRQQSHGMSQAILTYSFSEKNTCNTHNTIIWHLFGPSRDFPH